MSRDPEKAARLKEEGNRRYAAGDYIGAESLYSKAILANDAEPTLYTNRAMARIKLGQHDTAIWDCQLCIKLSGPNMKAYFIISQCFLYLHDYEGALDNALKAHRMGIESNDKSLPSLTNQVLSCKKARWEAKEKQRVREAQDLEREVGELMEKEKATLLSSTDDRLERAQIMDEWQQKMTLLTDIFERARSDSEKKRDVPDWAIDDISFGVMVDPVMTKSGKSYERASILEALRRHAVDPHTREPLHPSDLRPNLALREACEEFVQQNGWAVDW